jgi:Spx/MgsR family transcriptional regulator
MVLFGIPNCDTVKKAIEWLKENNIAFTFHDYKKQGIDAATLKKWSNQVGWEILLNKKSSTWRGLADATQAATTNQKKAVEVMVQNPTIIKRPVIETDGNILAIGFDEEKYRAAFL